MAALIACTSHTNNGRHSDHWFPAPLLKLFSDTLSGLVIIEPTCLYCTICSYQAPLSVRPSVQLDNKDSSAYLGKGSQWRFQPDCLPFSLSLFKGFRHFGMTDGVKLDVHLHEFPKLYAISAIHEGSALYRVLTQPVGRFPGKSIISLCPFSDPDIAQMGLLTLDNSHQMSSAGLWTLNEYSQTSICHIFFSYFLNVLKLADILSQSCPKSALLHRLIFLESVHSKKQMLIYVYFTHRFNAQTNYVLHAMCKIPLVQQVANSHWCNIF